ncbi:MAG: TetR/AcrR family transcriptional regulator [Thiomicrorhabdus sp.]|nr:MAG: TetR/AcrR family transcriptional regulator [Thiomicrorhabdus sp.]
MTEKVKKVSKTAQKIQQVATQLFAQNGFDGTIMDELAAVTGANKASIYYHFKNKEGLYDTCMTDLFAKVVDPVIEAVEAHQAVLDKLEAYVVAFSHSAYENRQMPAALMREIASGGVNMPVKARQQMQRLLFTLKDILKAGQDSGELDYVDPVATHFMVIGSLCFYICSEPMRLEIESTTKTDPSVDEATIEMVSLIKRALVKQS